MSTCVYKFNRKSQFFPLPLNLRSVRFLLQEMLSPARANARQFELWAEESSSVNCVAFHPCKLQSFGTCKFGTLVRSCMGMFWLSGVCSCSTGCMLSNKHSFIEKTLKEPHGHVTQATKQCKHVPPLPPVVMKREGDGGQPPSFCHTHHFIVFGPAVVPSQDPLNEEELQKQTLDLLVNFAYRLQMDGLMPDLPEQPPGEPSSGSGFLREVEGSKAKHPGAPLLEASMAMAPGPSPGICASSPASATTVLPVQPDVGLLAPATPEVPPLRLQQHASPKNYLVQFQKQWGRLTCTPDQVKKLLYCTKQKGSQASTGSSSTQDVSDRKVIHFLKHHMFLWFCFLCGIQVS